jgi:hypothetical protein
VGDLIAIVKFLLIFALFFGLLFLIEEKVRDAIWRRRMRKK